jgi:hypothetical protein
MNLTESQCGHEEGEIYDADCFWCPDCGELISYETGEVRVDYVPEYEVYECPGRSCAKYLYGMGHVHQRVKLD